MVRAAAQPSVPFILVAGLAAAAGPGTVGGQTVPEIPVVCMAEPTSAAQVDCATKYTLFTGYLGQMGVGVALSSLPAEWVDVLQEHYPNIDVGSWRFGFSDRQPPENATTDCDRTYYNSPTFVDQLRTGEGIADLQWLVHEIRHYEQCVEVGSRDDFSKLWWDDFDAVALETLLAGGSWDDLHGAMAMEQDAFARADEVRDALLSCCIHPETDALIEPIEVDPIQASAASPRLEESVELSVETRGGAEPRFYHWKATRPDGTTRRLDGDGDRVDWVPNRVGSWIVEVEVRHGRDLCADEPSTAMLPCEVRSRTIAVEPRLPFARSLKLEPAEIDVGDRTTATISVDDLAEREDQAFELAASDPIVRLPETVTVRGSGGWRGDAAIEIGTALPEGQVLFADRAVRIRAGIGPAMSRGTEAVLTVRGIRITRFEAVPVRDRTGSRIQRLLVELDRRVKAPITFRLENVAGSRVTLPPEIVVPAGATEGFVDVPTPRGLEKAVEVTVGLRHASRTFKPLEARMVLGSSKR